MLKLLPIASWTTSPFVNDFVMAQSSLRPLPKAEEQRLLDLITSNIKKEKTKAAPGDQSRLIQMDPRDPRADAGVWPCYGQHQGQSWQGNPHGLWIHCETCNLRLLYMPRVGSPSNSTQTLNHQMVQKMLQELEPLMNGMRPSARICKAMMDKITAEEQLNYLIREQMIKGSNAMSKSKAYPKSTASPSTPMSWELPVEETPPLDPMYKVDVPP